MAIWQLTNGELDKFSILVFSNEDEVFAGMFELDGKPKHWSIRPRVEPYVDKRKKAQKPLADISYVEHGTIVLNAKANAALKDLLLPFGQLLELECGDDIVYFYNVTTLIDVIDPKNSEVDGQSIVKEAFKPNSIPTLPTIFKDERTANRCIYVNQAAKGQLEKVIRDKQLTGVLFIEVYE